MEPDGDLHGMAAGEPSQEKEVSVGAGVRFSLHDRAEHFTTARHRLFSTALFWGSVCGAARKSV